MTYMPLPFDTQEAARLLSDAANGADDGDIYVQRSRSEGFVFDDGRIYNIHLVDKNNRRLDINLGTRIPFMSYLIRPIYGHPYPEHFLQEDVFTPTRNNIGKSIFRSGKVRTIDKYQSIKLVLGLHYYHNDHLKIGMNYEGSIQRVSDGRRLTYSYHDLILNVSYVY